MNPTHLFRIALTLAWVAAASHGAFAADPPDTITIGERFTIDSAVLEEERAYQVYLPASYSSAAGQNRRYPVVYLLDGGAHFHSATGVLQFMSGGINGNQQVPEMILVAIPNTDRTRDLTPTHTKVGFDGDEAEFLAASGGGDAFLRFVRDELFPCIDDTYRTRPFRMLVGHSFGGLLAAHAFINMPGLFDATIAIDPSLWWDGGKLVASTPARLASAAGVRGSIYITLANNPVFETGQAKKMELAGREFAMMLETARSDSLRSAMRYFDAEDHGSVPLLSLYHGLLFTFDGYKPGAELLTAGPAAVNEHFARFSKRIGMEFPPPETLVNQMGYLMLNQDIAAAIAFFQLNVENYPASSNVYDSLAEAYMEDGQTARAIEFYEKSLELDPDNQNAADRLVRLRSPEPSTP